MLAYKMLSTVALAGLFSLGACSGKGDAPAGNAAAGTTAEAAPAAGKMPKAGLWKMSVKAAGMPQPMNMQVCLGEPVAGANPFAPPAQPGQDCKKNSVTPTASGYAIEMECTANGMTTAIAGTVSGDFSTSYRTELTTKMSGANIPPAAQQEIKSSVDSTYAGACPAGMKPGETKQGA